MEAIEQHLRHLREKNKEPDWANALDLKTGTRYSVDTYDYTFTKLD